MPHFDAKQSVSPCTVCEQIKCGHTFIHRAKKFDINFMFFILISKSLRTNSSGSNFCQALLTDSHTFDSKTRQIFKLTRQFLKDHNLKHIFTTGNMNINIHTVTGKSFKSFVYDFMGTKLNFPMPFRDIFNKAFLPFRQPCRRILG